MPKSTSVSEAKRKFEQVLSLRQDIVNVFHILDSKLKVLREVYTGMVATHSNKEYVFGIDSFCFQNELIETDFVNLKDVFRRIDGRSYCEYYNLYVMVQQYVSDEIVDPKVKKSVNFTHNFPAYKHLDTKKVYSMDVVREMQGAITGCISELESHFQSRESSLQVDREQSELGLNIDNLVYTEAFRNAMLRARIDMYYRYLDVFHDHHSKYYTRLLLKAKLHLGIVNEDILIKQFSQQSIDRAEIANLRSPARTSPAAAIRKDEDAQIKSYVQYDDMATSRQNVLSHIIASTGSGSDNSSGENRDDESIPSDDEDDGLSEHKKWTREQQERFEAAKAVPVREKQVGFATPEIMDESVDNNNNATSGDLVEDGHDDDMGIPDESEVHSFTAVMESAFDQESIGKRVVVDGYETIGTIAFAGMHHVDATPRVGVILDTAIGRNNGVVKGHRYFQCEEGFGVLVVPYKVHLLEDVDRE